MSSIRIVKDITLTGTPDSPQTITYASLTDILGVALPASYTRAPEIFLLYADKDDTAFISEPPGIASFKVYKSEHIVTTLKIGIAVYPSSVAIAEDTTAYRVNNISISGTPATPQTINYADLTDVNGNTPAITDVPQAIYILSNHKANRVYLPAKPGATSFTICKTDVGVVGENIVIDIIIIKNKSYFSSTARIHRVSDVSITGSYDSPQTIYYGNLINDVGAALNASYANTPIVYVETPNMDAVCQLTAIPASTSFSIAKSSFWAIGETPKVNLIIIVDDGEVTAEEISLQSMIDLLNILLGDPDRDVFTPVLKLEMLNSAQEEMWEVLPDHLKKTFYVKQTALVIDANGEYDIDDLTYEMYDADRDIIQITHTDGYPVNKMSRQEVRKSEMYLRSYSTSSAFYEIRGNKLVFHGLEEDDTFTIEYYRKPATMLLGSTADDDTVCEFPRQYRAIILGLACHDFIDTVKSAARAYERAASRIETMKKFSIPTDTIKMGISHDDIISTDDNAFSIELDWTNVV